MQVVARCAGRCHNSNTRVLLKSRRLICRCLFAVCTRGDDKNAHDPAGEGRLAPSGLDCAFEDIPISSANYEEVVRVRQLIREEIRRFNETRAVV